MADFIKGIGGAALRFAVGSSEVKAIYLGETKIYELPYDAEIEYLQSTGTQYIDTGFNPSSSIRFIVDGKFNSSSDQDIGCLRYAGSITYRFHFGIYRTKFIFGVGTSYNNSYTYNTNRHTFELNGNGTAKLDSTSISINSSISTDGRIILFARDSTGSINNFSNFTLYGSQIYNGNTLVRDFIPVRVGTTGYLYDKVSKQLFGNAGSGNFTLGQDL